MLLRSSSPPRPRLARLLAPLAVVAVLTAACGSSDERTAAPDPAPSPATSSAPASPPPAASPAPSTTPAEEPSVEPVAITISDFAYEVPGPVPAGADLAVTNEDAEAHTFTVRDGESVVVQGGATEMMAAPGTAGTYDVVCDFHGGMTATLVVT